MNCSEWEQLLDAYLDGQLAGSLRLEFDAHRLRCRRCQQTLAMLEAAGHVIASNLGIPSIPADFTNRVMRRIGQPRQRVLRLRLTRVAIVAGAVAQAAAILAIAILWQAPRWQGPPAVAGGSAGVPSSEVDAGYEAVYGEIVARIEDRLWEMHRAGTKLTADVVNLARYLDIMLPEEVVEESSKMARVNPWSYLWGSIGPSEEPEPEPAQPSDTIHSI